VAEVSARIDKKVMDDDRKQWRGGTPEQWALESLAVVRTRCIGYLKSWSGGEIPYQWLLSGMFIPMRTASLTSLPTGAERIWVTLRKRD
jgi:hypothetical protein